MSAPIAGVTSALAVQASARLAPNSALNALCLNKLEKNILKIGFSGR
jgi:hypothetical protein